MAYTPNKAIHPGFIIAEALGREGLSQKSLSERTGISEKHLSQIINGEASITVETALALENALGGSASFWNNLEKNYQEVRARIDRAKAMGEEMILLPKFPYTELAKRGFVQRTTNKEKKVENLWKFFGVNSLAYVSTTEAAAFRKRKGLDIKSEAIATWLRCGELEAKKQSLPEYSEARLKETLPKLKLLSISKPEKFSAELVNHLNTAGVALVYVPHFRGTGVSGAVRWIHRTPTIQLSLYYAWADIFWFNLFHELGHLILHGRKARFIEFERRMVFEEQPQEKEADEFAGNELIPPKKYEQLLQAPLTRNAIVNFATTLGIHPGIVAGRLCHENRVDWKEVSSLRYTLRIAT